MNVFFIEILKKYYHKCSSPEYKNNKIVDTKELNLCYKIICTYSEVDIRDAPRAMNFDKFTTFIKIWKAKIDSN